jgi:hypothetical protein
MEKWYQTKHLVQALIDNNFVSGVTSTQKAYQWISKSEKVGKLKPIKFIAWSGRKLNRFRKSDIEEIIKAFSPGGAGTWEAKPFNDKMEINL